MEVVSKEHKRVELGSLELQCPPLPQTLLRAIDLMNQPDGPQMEQVLEMVQHDPGVTARLLRLVNSAYYGQRSQITSVSRAVLILGTVSVTGVVMSMGLNEVRTTLDARTTLPFLNLIRHSIATAFLARHLFSRDREADPTLQDQLGGVYTGALLHDFGKLILLYNYSAEAAALYTQAGCGEDFDVLACERDRFGYDHVETGVYLCRRLRFPVVLMTTIALHHREPPLDDIEPATRQLAYLVQAANKAAYALGFGCGRPLTWRQCCEDPLWARLVEERVVAYPDRDALLQDVLATRQGMEDYVDAIL